MENQIELLQRRLERERRARKAAEQFMEEKSRELYIKSQQLEEAIEAERKSRGETEILRQALETFTSELDLKEIVLHVETFIRRLIPHDSGSIYLCQKDGLRLQRLWGDFKEGRERGETISCSSLLDEMWLSSSPIVKAEERNEKLAEAWSIHRETLQWMIVPISVRDQKLGCIVLESRNEASFSHSTVKRIQALVNEAAIALENARLFREVERLSTIDPLTGLYNRRFFSATGHLEFERSLRNAQPLSAIMMDLDFFKRINDTYGHVVGDNVLIKVAAACLQVLRTSDLHGRYGGEEFCFLLPQTDIVGAIALAERLREVIAKLEFESDHKSFSVTASFGVAERMEKEVSLEHLLERSDQAMYRAKENGRNQVVASEPY